MIKELEFSLLYFICKYSFPRRWKDIERKLKRYKYSTATIASHLLILEKDGFIERASSGYDGYVRTRKGREYLKLKFLEMRIRKLDKKMGEINGVN